MASLIVAKLFYQRMKAVEMSRARLTKDEGEALA